MLAFDEILGRFDGVRKKGSRGAMVKCPCHADQTQSLSIDLVESGKGRRVLFHCFAGCEAADILKAKGLTWADVMEMEERDGRGSASRGSTGRRSGRGGKPVEKVDNQKAAGNRAGNGSGDPGREKLEDAGYSVHQAGGQDGRSGQEGGSDGRQDGGDRQRRGVGAGDRAVHGGDDGEHPGAGEDHPEMAQEVSAAGRQNGQGNRGGESGESSQGNRGGQNGQGNRGGQDGQGNRGGQNGPDGKDGEKAPEIDWNNPDAVYSYTDAAGKELFQVVRYHYKNAPGKTFRQRMQRPGDPKANAGGWVHSVPEDIRNRTLYRMPEIGEAIRKGEIVYVVEGEKDVETLRRLGKTATCNPGGAGKWRDSYSDILAGADLVILPDNDPRNDKGGYPGQDHAFSVAIMSQGKAKRIRIVNLKEACPQLPEKGDVSDLVALMGDTEGMDALARQTVATKDFDPQMVPFWLTPMEQAERLYAQVSGYGVKDGAIVQKTGDSIKPLCDFVVIPRSEIIRDDGVSTDRYFTLDGWNQSGQKLPRVTIKSRDLDGMAWIRELWGYGAAIVPGSTTKAKVAWCIAKVGQMMSKTVIEYSHTGWRKIGGKWAYLYQGGAIGAGGVTVNLEEGLRTYRLDGSGAPGFQEMPFREAAKKSLEMLEVAKRGTALALLGTMFLAPLREWMDQTDVAPAFSLFLHGQTQTRKSTLTALAMAHFGNFHAKNAPTNFKSTGNNITRKAFMCKDMPLWVDDFHPTDSQQEKRAMNATAQRLARAFGDGADRGRLNADGTLQTNRPPRSIAVITGEDLPAVGASGLARFFIIDVDKGDVPVTEKLTALQEAARQGWLQRSMRGYILWLSQQTDKLPDRLHEMYTRYRDEIRRKGAGDQERAPEALACILIGLREMLEYMVAVEAVSGAEAQQLIGEALDDLTEASRRQSREMESEKPTRIFLDTVAEMIASGKVSVWDLVLDAEKKKNYPQENMIGYRDNEYYYLLPNMAFREVSRVCREEGHEFPVSLKALYKHLIADGAVTGVKDGESPARPKTINGKSVRVIRIAAETIEGTGESEREGQTVMPLTKVQPEGLPEGW